MTTKKTLAPEELCRLTDPGTLPFETTAALEDPPAATGQERALAALRFGLGMQRSGYNVFALGPAGIGKHETVLRALEQEAARRPVPDDWCYVYNFADPNRPRALRLPPGRGAGFHSDMQRLIAELRVTVPAAFESEAYRTRRKLLEEQFKERHERAFAEIEARAGERNVALLRTPVGLALAPSRNGEVMDPDEFHRLPAEQQDRFKADMKEIQDGLQRTLTALPALEREQRSKIRDLDQEVVRFAVGHSIDELRPRYADLPQVLQQLDAVRQDVLDNADELIPRGDGDAALATLLRQTPRGETRSFRRYEVNLIVDHAASAAAPVVYEDYPTQPSLLGRIEHQSELGALVTDFHLIKAGVLHRASGGYLVLDARKLLLQGFAWDQLKRALRGGSIRIESIGQALGLVSTVSLDPEPIPLDVKVVLVGDRMLYYLLAELDPDFLDLFKVQADFDDVITRDAEGELAFARLLGSLARREKLLPLDRSGVARAIEYGARLAGDAERLSLQVESIADLVREADQQARDAGRGTIAAQDVDSALAAQIRRADRVREKTQEEIARGTILIATSGEAVGQVNGLSVLQLGRFAFGRPSRITARVRLGSGQVVDIEREVALGGPIHSKGVLILSGFLGARYASDRPLSLSASLVFEQSYGGVEGDSASLGELVALVSALAGAPVKQCLAVTGSVNQQGQVQPIGGVNEKIEGFFEVCQARGLAGTEGVLIPAANVKHLALRRDVVEAASRGLFHVHAVETVDEALELMTGLPAGDRDELGNFPEGTVNHRAEARLALYAEQARAYGRTAHEPDRGH